jgi:beta-hydroxylase
MSTADQVEETLAKHFAGQSGLVVAEVDLSGFGEALKWEVSRGGALFPHLYGVLPMAAVITHDER